MRQMSVGIDESFEMLSWNSDGELQEKGIQKAMGVKNFQVFIKPINRIDVWANCAIVLATKTDQELEPYLFAILEWFQNPYWPGFITIYKRMRKISVKILKYPFLSCVKEAKALEEYDTEWLAYLSGLIANQELLDSLPPDLQELMKKEYPFAQRFFQNEERELAEEE